MSRFALLLLFLATTCTQVFSQRMPEHWHRSVAAFENGEHNLALVYVDSCLSKRQTNPDFLLLKGQILFATDSIDASWQLFAKADENRKGFGALWLAKVEAIKGNAVTATAFLEQHLLSAYRISESAIVTDKAFAPILGSAEWKTLWLTDWYNSAERTEFEASYHIGKGEYDLALDLLNERLARKSKRSSYLALRAQAYLGLQSYKAAAADIEAAIRKSRKRHEYRALSAQILLAQGKGRQAMEQAEKALELSGGDPKYLVVRAEAKLLLGDKEGAYSDFQTYLTYYPKDFGVLYSYAAVAFEVQAYVSALKSINPLIALQPRNTDYLTLRGLCYQRIGNAKLAIEDFSRVLSIRPLSAEVLVNRANAYSSIGEKEKACSDLKQASELGLFKAQELFYNRCRR